MIIWCKKRLILINIPVYFVVNEYTEFVINLRRILISLSDLYKKLYVKIVIYI